MNEVVTTTVPAGHRRRSGEPDQEIINRIRLPSPDPNERCTIDLAEDHGGLAGEAGFCLSHAKFANR